MTRSQVEHDRARMEKAIRFGLDLSHSTDIYNPNHYEDNLTAYLDREYPLPCQACSGKVAVPEDVKKWAHGTVTCDVQEMSLARAANAARFILSLAEGAK